MTSSHLPYAVKETRIFKVDNHIKITEIFCRRFNVSHNLIPMESVTFPILCLSIGRHVIL